MTLTVGTASGNKTLSALYIGTASGAKAVSEGWVGTASGNRPFYSSTPPPPSLAASIYPPSQYWQVVTPGSYWVSSEPFIASATGGDGAYTYAWEADDPTSLFNDPMSASTGMDTGYANPTQVRCLVSDGSGNSAYTGWAVIN